MFDSVWLSLKGLRKKKMRTFLTVFAISIGVASVLIISTVSEFGKTSVNSELDSLGLGGLAISCDSGGIIDLGISGDKKEILAQNPNVEAVMPIILHTSSVNVRDTSASCIIFGIDSNATNIVSMDVQFGRFIENYDVLSGKNVCMIDANLAKTAYMRENIVGKTIKLNINNALYDFQVIGIVKTGTGILQNMMGEYVPTFVYVPSTALQKIGNRNDFDSITVKLKDGADIETVSEQLVQSLKLNSESGTKYVAENLSQQRGSLENLMDTVSVVLSAIGFISLVVAGMGIMTIMLVSVNERTKEIGIKKSIGAKRSTILLEFMVEALVITVIGCILGLIIGGGLVWLACGILKCQISLNIHMILISIICSLIVGLIFGVYPAVKAANMKPVDALRTD